MPNITPEGYRLPAGTDNYALTNDLRLMMESANTIVPVANITARVNLVAALTTAGRAPTATDPLYVHRADAPLGFELEITKNGSSWQPVNSISRTANQFMQGTSQVITLNSAGAGTVVFPVTYPDSVSSVVLTVAEDSGAMTANLVNFNPTQTTGFNFRVRGSGGVQLGAVPIRLNWIAIGR